MKTKSLECACCGGYAPAYKQWYNRDKGYGVCDRCFKWSVERYGVDISVDYYGRPGEHHSISEKAADE